MNAPPPTIDRNGTRLASLLTTAALALVLAGCGDDPEQLERSAKAYLAKGDRVSAAIQYKSLLTLEPNHVEAQLQLGKISAEIGALADAESSLRLALELGKRVEDVAPALGEVLLELGKHKDVLELLEPDAKRTQPTDPKLLAEFSLLRARAYLGLGDLTSAGTQFQLAMAAQPSKAKLGLAGVAAQRNDRARAEELIRQVLATDPRDVDAHLALGELRRTAGALDEALTHFAEAVKVQPNHVNALLIHGIALTTANRTEEARRFVDAARKLAPSKPLTQFAQAMIDCRERRYEQCGEALQKVFEVTPQYMPAVLLAGQLNYSTANYELAQAAFARYHERFPGNTYARTMLAATLLARGQAGAALTLLRPILAANTADAEMLSIAGQALLQLGHPRNGRAALAKAVKLAPDNAEYRTALGLAHVANGMHQRAEADFRAAIALKPENIRADRALVAVLLQARRVGDAKEIAAAAEQRLRRNPEAQMLKGIVARAAGDARGAREAFLKAIELDRNFFPAVEELAGMDVQDRKPDAARVRIQDVLSRNRDHLDALLLMARLELDAGRRPEALAWARQAADAHPRSLHAMVLVAEIQMEGGDIQEAMASARQALSLRPRDPRSLRILGMAQMAAKDYAGAATTFSTLTGAQPGSNEGYLLLAAAHLAARDLTAATAVARNALKRDPDNTDFKLLLGDILLRGKKYGDALEFARQVQRASPQSALGHRLEGDILLAQGDPRRAVKSYEAAAKLEPKGAMLASVHRAWSLASPGSEREAPLEDWVKKHPDDDQTRMYLADALSAKGRQKEAIAHYQELFRRNPRDPRMLNNLAWAMHAAGDPKAIDFAEQAYQLRPAEAAVVDTFGWVLVNRGRLHEGIQILLKAVALDGKNPEIRYHLAKALAQAGDKTRARAELKVVLSSGKDFSKVDEARALLASLGQ